MGPFELIGGTVAGVVTNNKNRKFAERQRKQQMDLINSLDWEPEYASNNVPAYQKTKSPIAGSWLDSYLMGDNPAAISSTAPNAQILKAQAQARQNANFGTPAERLAEQRAIQASNPYQVTPPTRPVMGPKSQDAAYSIENPGAKGWGVDRELHDSLVAGGYLKDGEDINTALDTRVGKKNAGNYAVALKNALAAGDGGAVNDLLHPNYEGHGMAQHIRQRRRARKVGRLIDRYDGED